VGGPILTLEFLTGPYQGSAVALAEGAEIVIGRESDLDVVLPDDLVSRKHARIAVHEGEAVLQDLASTNGTFVNGQRVKRARLAPGDRVVIGAAMMRVVAPGARAPAPPPLPRERRSAAPERLTGRIEEVPLPDLLQLLASSRKTGTMVIAGAGDEARLHVSDGRPVGCVLASAPGIPSRKAVWRILRWTAGTFELRAPEALPAEATLDAPMEAVLLDGLRQLDELRALGDRAPAPGARVGLAAPPAVRLRDLAPEELDLLQLALERGTVQGVLDASPETDADVLKALTALVEKGVLRVAG
jgi:hypothetical protein